MKYRLPLLASACAVALTLSFGAAKAEVSPLDLVQPIADYKVYVQENLDVLVKDTKAFTDAVKAGDLEKAKELYPSTRVSYEKIEPIAELFADLDASIDSRADDHENGEKSEDFTGFHRIEYGLFAQNSTEGLAPVADKLYADVLELQKRVKDLTVPPEKVVGGAAALLEEVAATKISGEEDRYSHTDLWDFKANVDGAQKIVELFKPLLEKENPDLVKKVEANFKTVDDILAKYKKGEGYESYDKLSEDDRKALAGPVTTLAEDLSTLRGTLGLN
ncbi:MULTISPECIES: iron uptake system protein EfeO [Brucella/Ochrobactrum group]|jgi:iron uptake system component EfeO|uniref:Iron uptake system protein EfeO n=1 Tax=Brucella pseudintermedia TaxID=370111 RepID=A0ABY5UIA0_9HYPH|nr:MULTISPECIES: iron uptake system protein EfeO [Brucella/Ochrobactrum group]KAB2684626.1 iron uptake system protein EfeO [Brucella pseudintermedia]MCO7728114.1 iron uptake system protein EfeO [Brucella intermedia]NKE74668.1 iron uptake system protein EfeO [Ochrobactrum sp. MC-1LL]TWG97596.1 iron uptake system component EfeO [Ochrobactrum sp. J50]UWL62097.1 iron uptake system protein EfeO [Brucella pseudintermedia]